ncbi:hypothetical protein [Methylobrevis pamukkalensis]|uniref:Uncharacterized protein n=1 Tax=Methylobrevis pamukkalensis TaxID=1439726 RepID=A0A1E3H7Q6_9HYPH|nr:hypothetical protein [Methylobrevis pamukkalensis]ODN72334.1 hypothetical protein A6302_00261 [Methylobrevis pamukkalensis]
MKTPTIAAQTLVVAMTFVAGVSAAQAQEAPGYRFARPPEAQKPVAPAAPVPTLAEQAERRTRALAADLDAPGAAAPSLPGISPR